MAGTGSVKISVAWDSTTDVLAGRAGQLTPLAAGVFFLPAVAQAAVRGYAGTGTFAGVLGLLVGIAALLVTLWGQLAVLAIASDPAITRAEAGALAGRRLPAQLAALVAIGAIVVLALLPFAVALAATGYDIAAATAAIGRDDAAAVPPLAPAATVFILLYGLVLAVAALWATARLFLVNAAVLNERRGLGAIARSVAMTRGLTWKLIGTTMLFVVVYLIAVTAVQLVVRLVAGLVLGGGAAATTLFLAAIAAAAVTAVFTVIVQVFAARVYAACRAREAGAATVPA